MEIEQFESINDVLAQRIATTSKTSVTMFREIDAYIKAAFAFYRDLDSSDRDNVLRGQLLAKKLTSVVPIMMRDIEREIAELNKKEENNNV